MCAWYNIQNDNIAAEAAERPATGKCGFCGEPLEHETRYCSRECAIADNSERV